MSPQRLFHYTQQLGVCNIDKGLFKIKFIDYMAPMSYGVLFRQGLVTRYKLRGHAVCAMPNLLLIISTIASPRCNQHLLALRLTLLQVFLERWSSRNGLAGVLVFVGFGVTGIGHTSLPKLLVDGTSAGDLSDGGESRGGGHEGGDDGKLVL